MSRSPDLPADIPFWRERLGQYWKLVRGDRPIGWLLLLWPTWWGLWLAADGMPPLWTLVVFSLGVWLTRSAGCVINDYADRWLDPLVERTKGRPLATGAVRGREALAVFAVLMLVAFALVLTLNRLTVMMSGVGVLLAATYPYLKRHTYLPQVYLGLAFGWGIPMAFAAIRGEVPAVAWVLYVANILWTTAYDTWYAMVDREDDLRAGAKSTAILFGDLDLVALAILYALFGAGSIGLRAVATGLPASILLDPRRSLADACASRERAQFVIWSTSGSGDPSNANVPGTYDDQGIAHSLDPLMAPTPMTAAMVAKPERTSSTPSIPAMRRNSQSFCRRDKLPVSTASSITQASTTWVASPRRSRQTPSRHSMSMRVR